MRTSTIAIRILLAIGAGGLSASSACGGTTSTGPAADASTDTGVEAGSDGAAGDAADDGATADGGGLGDGGADGRPDAPACVRRPFLVGGGTRASGVASRRDWAAEDVAPVQRLDERAARVLATAWLEAGLQEHASIAAFARFSLMALSVGARPEHIAGAQRASLDEIAHARACFSLAKRYGGEDVGPGAVGLDGALEPLSLEELAVLTVHEGCVGETLGVQIATAQLAFATDPVVRRTLEKIVRDETRHAELAWSFVRWALDVGDAALRDAVTRAFDEAARASRRIATAADHEPEIAELLHAHGHITGAETRASVDEGLRDVVRPCARALLARPTARPVAAQLLA